MPARNEAKLTSLTCVRRAALQRRPTYELVGEVDGAPKLWFVTVTVGGDPLAPERVRQAVERLSMERALVGSARYAPDCAELRYWDESDDVDSAIRQALLLWGDGEVAELLPGWHIIGLGVVDRPTARRQNARGDHPMVFELGEVVPFD